MPAFEDAFQVKQHIQKLFPGVVTTTTPPSRFRWTKVPMAKKPGKFYLLKNLVPISAEEAARVEPFVVEYKRLYYGRRAELAANSSFSDEEIMGDRPF